MHFETFTGLPSPLREKKDPRFKLVGVHRACPAALAAITGYAQQQRTAYTDSTRVRDRMTTHEACTDFDSVDEAQVDSTAGGQDGMIHGRCGSTHVVPHVTCALWRDSSLQTHSALWYETKRLVTHTKSMLGESSSYLPSDHTWIAIRIQPACRPT